MMDAMEARAGEWTASMVWLRPNPDPVGMVRGPQTHDDGGVQHAAVLWHMCVPVSQHVCGWSWVHVATTLPPTLLLPCLNPLP